jgi:hypothetical protein
MTAGEVTETKENKTSSKRGRCRIEAHGRFKRK